MKASRPHGFQLVEHRQAQLGGLGVARVLEGREDVGVLVAGEAIRVGDRRRRWPARTAQRSVVGREHGPCERLASRLIAPGFAELLAPKRGVAGVVAGEPKGPTGREQSKFS